MALFKINKGLAENLAKNMPYAKEGFAYFTKDDGKFYIDIAGDGTTTEAIVNVNRIPLNAAKADIATMIQATAMATDDNKVYPILAFNITDFTKNLVEAKYSQIGIKNGTLVIPSVEDKDEILISNEGLGRGIVIDNKGTNNAIEILNGKGIKVAQDPTENLELTTKQYVDNQNVVLELNMAGSTYWTNQTSYDFTLSTKAQAAYSRLIEAIKKGYIPTVIIHDIDNTYTYKYSFIQNLILVFAVEIPLSKDGNHIGKDFIAFQSNVSGTTLTVQRLNKPLEYIPGGGKVNQILSVSNNGQATWLDIPSIEDLGGATKNHTHDDRYYIKNEINDKLNAINDKIGALLGANDALVFKGIIDGKHPLPTANYEVGHTYRVNEAGTYAGQKCEQGDLIICIADALSTNTPHWTVAQTNIDGAVTGPDASTVNAVPTFADAKGKVIKDNSTVTIDNTGLFTAPYIATGTDKTHYFQSRKFRGEGDADTYYHAIDFGYSGHNQVDFHEYGGIWNFYKNTKGTATDGKLVASIKPDGFHGNLNGNATSADKVTNNLVLKLNSGTTEDTNQFTYNGSAVKTVDITPAKIGAASSSHNHDTVYVKKAGDTITGDIKFQKTNTDGTISTTATIGATTGYITGTWLQTTSVGNKTGDFATIDSSGWIYKRTAAQAREDMGLSTAMHFIGKATVDITDGSTVDPKITGYTTKTAGDVIIDKNNSYEYVWTLEGKWERLGPDGSYSVVGHTHDDRYYTESEIDTKLSSKSDASHNHDTTYVKKTGDTMSGNLITSRSDSNDAYFRATNSNGSIGLLSSTNQGLYDYTNSKWIAYHNKSNGINYFNGLATKATQDKNGLQIDTNYLKLSGGTMSGKITFKFTTSKPAKGTRLPVLSGQYQNGSGAYYSTDLVDMIGTASTIVNHAAVRFGSTSGATFITSGEGGCVFPSKLDSNLVDCENISFCADGGFNFWGNISNDGSTYTSYMNMSGTKITAYQPLYGAVWNDYAEFREGDTIEAGHCVIEVGDDTLITSTERLMPGANITSDTFGFSIGETEQAKTPIAVSGRVLAYPYESREEFKKNIGRPVCSGPNGTVSIMTDEEYRDKGYCAIGTISAVPDYEEWGTGKVKVNGRVWIKVF